MGQQWTAVLLECTVKYFMKKDCEEVLRPSIVNALPLLQLNTADAHTPKTHVII